jgi:hypothetical protein
MAGARPSSFKRGGGFLNNVDGVITGYQWTDQFPGDGKAKKGKSDFNPLFFVLSARADGAEDDVTTHIFAGGADDFEISDDGYTLEPLQEDGGLRQGTPFSKFLDSLLDKGFPEDALPEDSINYQAIIGTRVTFIQVKDMEATDRAGQRVDKKTGKKYDRTNTQIGAVLALPSAGGKAGSKGAKADTKGKKAAAAAEEDDEDLTQLAVETLLAVIEDADGAITKNKLTVKIPQKLGLKHPHQQDVRKLATSDEFLKSEQGWTYDAKKGVIFAE